MKKAISRRDFLKVVGVSATALGLTACGGSSASTAASSTAASSAAGAGEGGSGNDFTLTWNEVNGEDYGATVGAHTFAEKIEELSGGHIKIDLYINGTLGSEAESMQGIQMGTLDIFRGNASSLPNYGAELIGTTGLPYVFKDMAQFEDVAESSLGDELLQSVEDANCGYVALGWLVEGPRSLFITPKVYDRLGKPDAFTLDKMKGLKVRVPETDLMISTMDALGASATAIAYSELYTSLQSGRRRCRRERCHFLHEQQLQRGRALLYRRCAHLRLRCHPDERRQVEQLQRHREGLDQGSCSGSPRILLRIQ